VEFLLFKPHFILQALQTLLRDEKVITNNKGENVYTEESGHGQSEGVTPTFVHMSLNKVTLIIVAQIYLLCNGVCYTLATVVQPGRLKETSVNNIAT
jgi:hypothetical protein